MRNIFEKLKCFAISDSKMYFYSFLHFIQQIITSDMPVKNYKTICFVHKYSMHFLFGSIKCATFILSLEFYNSSWKLEMILFIELFSFSWNFSKTIIWFLVFPFLGTKQGQFTPKEF